MRLSCARGSGRRHWEDRPALSTWRRFSRSRCCAAGSTGMLFFSAPRAMVQWIPLKTTLQELRLGAWPLIYHVAVNLAWFAPLGFFARKNPAWVSFVVGALLSALLRRPSGCSWPASRMWMICCSTPREPSSGGLRPNWSSDAERAPRPDRPIPPPREREQIDG